MTKLTINFYKEKLKRAKKQLIVDEETNNKDGAKIMSDYIKYLKEQIKKLEKK